MIAYRDFGMLQHESFDAAVRAANEWIREKGIMVFNVETVIHSSHPNGPTILRVWYKA